MMFRLPIVFLILVGLAGPLLAQTMPVTYYVDVQHGDDAQDGLTPQTAYAHIQKAVDQVNPGDTVILAPGEYFESVVVQRMGLPDKPITIKADRVQKGFVVISGADRAIRQKQIRWQLEDAALQLYSIPSPTAGLPSTVLYSGADLYPYRDLEHLKTFTVPKSLSKTKDVDVPGPNHGYTWSEKTGRLYVRLHASGRYGSTDPNEHTMTVAPLPDGVGYGMLGAASHSLSNIRILGDGWPAHVIVDGLTFESPSLAGVYTSASDVTIRNCWFVGCRVGVCGNGGDQLYDRGRANRINVHHCVYTQWPVYDDGVETILQARKRNEPELFWHRKHPNEGLPGGRFIYETGLLGNAGRDWDIHHNLVSNAFEAFSGHGTSTTQNLCIHDNIIEKMLDNAVETENHSQGMQFYRNVLRDVFSPISWQPQRGKPYPGGIRIYQNVIYNTPEHLAVFGFRHPPVFKIMGESFAPIASPGLLCYNNTIYWPDAQLLGASATGNHPDQLGFFNNIFAVDVCFRPGSEWEPDEAYTFARNLVAAIDPRVFAHRVMGGRDGIMLESDTQIGFTDLRTFNLSVKPGSAAVGRGVSVPGAHAHFNDIGAVQQGDTWYPLQVGPMITAP